MNHPAEAVTPSLECSVESRLVALERSNRRWRVIATGGVLALVATWLGGWMSGAQPANPRSMQTQQLIITGSDGQPRIMMTGSADGSSMFLYGTDAYRGRGGGAGGAGGGGGAGGAPSGAVGLSPRIRLMADKDGPRLEILDGEGKKRVIVQVDADGPRIERLDADGNAIESDG